MSDYTPTTDEVRGGFATAPMAHEPRECAEAEFDRWLAARDREVREALLVELNERHLAAVQWPNEYKIRAVPQAVLLDLIERERKAGR